MGLRAILIHESVNEYLTGGFVEGCSRASSYIEDEIIDGCRGPGSVSLRADRSFILGLEKVSNEALEKKIGIGQTSNNNAAHRYLVRSKIAPNGSLAVSPRGRRRRRLRVNRHVVTGLDTRWLHGSAVLRTRLTSDGRTEEFIVGIETLHDLAQDVSVVQERRGWDLRSLDTQRA